MVEAVVAAEQGDADKLLEQVRIATEVMGQIVEDIKFDPLVASRTGVRGSSVAVLIDEVVDDLAELLCVVERVERDVETIGNPPGIDGILDGAAGTALFGRLTSIAKSEKGADHFVPFFFQQVGRRARVDPTTHRHQYLRQ